MLINIFFVLMEFFTAFYSNIPEHAEHFRYLYVGLEGHRNLVPWMWSSAALALLAAGLLLSPAVRERRGLLAFTCTAVIVSIWIEKGLGMVVTGFVPSPLGHVTPYSPTLPEVLIGLGIYAFGALLVTLLYKVALSVRDELAT
jgi:molybdopterin-containing oxidoreductase family membrane subunit